MNDEAMLIDALRAGVSRTRRFIDQLTEYHGGPVETEYLLTSDLMREFLDRGREISVEGLNRDACSALASSEPYAARAILKRKRTDVVVGDKLIPDALIEVKIRISRHTGIAADLRKICSTIDLMKPSRQRSIIGASVFQMHLKATRRRWERAHFELAVKEFETQMKADLGTPIDRYENYDLELVDLMASASDGIVDREIIHDHDGAPMVGESGHATRYYAVIVKHRIYGSAPPSNYQEMKAERGR